GLEHKAPMAEDVVLEEPLAQVAEIPAMDLSQYRPIRIHDAVTRAQDVQSTVLPESRELLFQPVRVGEIIRVLARQKGTAGGPGRKVERLGEPNRLLHPHYLESFPGEPRQVLPCAVPGPIVHEHDLEVERGSQERLQCPWQSGAITMGGKEDGNLRGHQPLSRISFRMRAAMGPSRADPAWRSMASAKPAAR